MRSAAAAPLDSARRAAVVTPLNLNIRVDVTGTSGPALDPGRGGLEGPGPVGESGLRLDLALALAVAATRASCDSVDAACVRCVRAGTECARMLACAPACVPVRHGACVRVTGWVPGWEPESAVGSMGGYSLKKEKKLKRTHYYWSVDDCRNETSH